MRTVGSSGSQRLRRPTRIAEPPRRQRGPKAAPAPGASLRLSRRASLEAVAMRGSRRGGNLTKPRGAGTARTISLTSFRSVKTTNVSQSNFERSLEVHKRPRSAEFVEGLPLSYGGVQVLAADGSPAAADPLYCLRESCLRIGKCFGFSRCCRQSNRFRGITVPESRRNR